MAEEKVTPDDGGKKTEEAPKDEKKFTQADMDHKIGERLDRAKGKGRKEVFAEVFGDDTLTTEEARDMWAELKDFKRERAEAETNRKREEGNFDAILADEKKKHKSEVEQIQQTAAEKQKLIETRLALYENQLVNGRLAEALRSAGCYAGEDGAGIQDAIAAFKGGKYNLAVEDGDVIVKDADGTRAVNGGEHVTVEMAAKEFVSARPHFQKGSDTKGSGTETYAGMGADDIKTLMEKATSPNATPEDQFEAMKALKGKQ